MLGYLSEVSDSPPRLAKLFSAAQCARYVSFGWSVKHEIREAPGDEPYEYILEWARTGRPISPKRWSENWVGLAQGGAQADALEAELRRELGPGHVLFEQHLRPLARCAACDDVIFEVGAVGYVIVHLTWSGRAEPAPWPDTRHMPTDGDLGEAVSSHEH